MVLKDQYRILGENVARVKPDLMKEQLATFSSQLEEFARKHKGNSMRCVLKLAWIHWHRVRVFGQSCYRLVTSIMNLPGVQILEICLATRPRNGGFDQSARTLHPASSEKKR
nr:vacuolar protein sorting-associated protein 22 homolog 1-like [Populus alba]